MLVLIRIHSAISGLVARALNAMYNTPWPSHEGGGGAGGVAAATLTADMERPKSGTCTGVHGVGSEERVSFCCSETCAMMTRCGEEEEEEEEWREASQTYTH